MHGVRFSLPLLLVLLFLQPAEAQKGRTRSRNLGISTLAGNSRVHKELKLSDGQLGLLTGLAFALFYATLSLPIARLADRFNRRNIIAASIATWSGMTTGTGTALCWMTFSG